MKKVILFSGGVDSTISLYYLLKTKTSSTEIIPVFVNYGQVYAKKEESACKTLLEMMGGPKLEIINLVDNLKSKPQFNDFVSNRNLTLCSIVATLFSPDSIILSGLRDDNVVDNNLVAYEEMSHQISKYCGNYVEIFSPLIRMSKGEAVEWYLKKLKGPNIILENTISCFGDHEHSCNNCPACMRRYVALYTNGLKVEPVSAEIMKTYLNKIHNYDKDRISRFLIAAKPILGRINSIDMDGILCESDASLDYKNKKPIEKNIKIVNLLPGLNIINTSRFYADREFTIDWLISNNVRFDALFTNKLPYDITIDDKNFEI